MPLIVFAQSSAGDPASRRASSTTHRLGKTTKPLTSSVRLTTCNNHKPLRRYPSNQLAAIAAIGPDQVEARGSFFDFIE